MIKGIIFDWGRVLYDADRNVLFPETVKCLDKISKKYKLAIVSLASDGNIDRRLKLIKENNLEKYFSVILFNKEDKDSLYVSALSKMGLKNRELVIIDDRVIRGIRWGNENGTQTVWVKKGKFSNELPNEKTGSPTYIIENLTEILHLFNN